MDTLVTASLDRTSYPLWILFSVERLKVGGFAASLPVHTDLISGDKFAPVFTDKDLAQRWIDENPLDDARELMPIEDLGRLRYILGLYLQGGVEYVGTDLSTRKLGEGERRGELRTIRAYLGQLKER